MRTISTALAIQGHDSKNNFLLLRLAAATAVIYGHAFPLAAECGTCTDVVVKYVGYKYSGQVAVEVFFVMSGFLVTASLAYRNDVASFFKSRFLRIFPALLVFVLITAFGFGPILTKLPFGEYFSSRMLADYVVQNSTFQLPEYNLPGVLEDNRWGTAAAGTLWSLWVEVRLYLLVALLGVLGATRSKTIGNATIGLLVLWGVFYPTLFPFMMGNPDNVELSIFFGIGALMYINRDNIMLDWECLLLAFIAVAIPKNTEVYPYAVGGFLAYATICLAFAKKIEIPGFIQDYSYGIYLYGFPIQQALYHYFPSFGPYKHMALAIPLAWIAGTISWFAIEKPALSLKSRIRQTMQTM